MIHAQIEPGVVGRKVMMYDIKTRSLFGISSEMLLRHKNYAAVGLGKSSAIVVDWMREFFGKFFEIK